MLKGCMLKIDANVPKMRNITNAHAKTAHSSPAILHGDVFLHMKKRAVRWSQVRGSNVGCTSIVCRGALVPLVSLPLNILGVVFAKLGERHQSPDGKPMLIGWQLECKVKPWAPGPKSSSIWLQRSHYITAEGLPNKVTWVCFAWRCACLSPMQYVYISSPAFPLRDVCLGLFPIKENRR